MHLAIAKKRFSLFSLTQISVLLLMSRCSAYFVAQASSFPCSHLLAPSWPLLHHDLKLHHVARTYVPFLVHLGILLAGVVLVVPVAGVVKHVS